MASLPRTLFRPARRVLARSAVRVPSRALVVRGMATVGNAPPMEPQKERLREMAVGEFEGATFTIEPLRRVGEDEKTMRARLVYQSRKRGILETDLLLSTFADQYLATMSREQMVEYDLFLDENDWDIYYWATQEEPSSSSTTTNSSSSQSSTSSSSASSSTTTTTTIDTSSATYGSSAETAIAAAAAESQSTSTGEHEGDTKEAYTTTDLEQNRRPGARQQTPATPKYAGEWAQTVGTFKPAYRPVPARWRDSDVLRLVREHVRARSGEKGGMAFMPALRSS
ncbi:Flavinator of succinate dehydrogenase-domain-containing protein [Xylaria castorea]|nr:Flavinator of succinate dehydrogenase-domain-containing protein [Xylaria castorea]